MPLLLRKVRKSRWQDRPEWLGEDETHADAVTDLYTQLNELSVWRVQDDKSDVVGIIVAMAATKDHLANLDYALFDENAIAEVGIEHECTTGDTPHTEANSKHVDLVKLSGHRLLKLAKLILARGTITRVLEKKVGQMLVQAVKAGKIRLDLLKPGVKEKLKQQLGTGASTPPS